MKYVNFFDRLRFIFRASYRREVKAKEAKAERQAMFSKGKRLWNAINAKLTLISDDFTGFEKRREFKKFLAPLSKKDRASLSFYLECEVEEIEDNFCEITSGVHERFERERLQDYRYYIACLE